MRANLIKLIPAALLLLGIAQSARAQAYLGVGGGTSFGQATFRSITEHQVHWGGQGSLFAGYRLGRLVSLELDLQYGGQSQYALDCCPYWLSSAGERYMAPLPGAPGWWYKDIHTETRWGKVAFQANFDLLSLVTRDGCRWSFNVSPQIAAVTTQTTLVTDTNLPQERQWHPGYGGQVSLGLRLTDRLDASLYYGVTCLGGERFDGMPVHAHKSNLFWDGGLRLAFNLGK